MLAIEETSDILALSDFIDRYIVPEDMMTVSDQFEQANENKHNKEYETSFSCRVITNHGWMRYIFIKGKVINDNMSFGIAQDVTAQKNLKTHC